MDDHVVRSERRRTRSAGGIEQPLSQLLLAAPTRRRRTVGLVDTVATRSVDEENFDPRDENGTSETGNTFSPSVSGPSFVCGDSLIEGTDDEGQLFLSLGSAPSSPFCLKQISQVKKIICTNPFQVKTKTIPKAKSTQVTLVVAGDDLM